MSMHNDSVNAVHIVLLILHLQVCFPFVYLHFIQSSFIIVIVCVSHKQLLHRKRQSRVLCRFIPCEEPLALHWVTLLNKEVSNYTSQVPAYVICSQPYFTPSYFLIGSLDLLLVNKIFMFETDRYLTLIHLIYFTTITYWLQETGVPGGHSPIRLDDHISIHHTDNGYRFPVRSELVTIAPGGVSHTLYLTKSIVV